MGTDSSRSRPRPCGASLPNAEPRRSCRSAKRVGIHNQHLLARYDPARARVPYLRIDKAAPESSPAYARVPNVLEALRYAEITRFAFRDATHGDFIPHAIAGQSASFEHTYATAVLAIRLFLQARLSRAEGAADRLARLSPPAGTGPDFFTRSVKPAEPAAPSEEELFRLAGARPGRAGTDLPEVSALRPGETLFREHVLTRAAIFAEPREVVRPSWRSPWKRTPIGQPLSAGHLAPGDGSRGGWDTRPR